MDAFQLKIQRGMDELKPAEASAFAYGLLYAAVQDFLGDDTDEGELQDRANAIEVAWQNRMEPLTPGEDGPPATPGTVGSDS